MKNYLQNIKYGNIMCKYGSLVKRLRRRPLTAETRVRFPYGLRICHPHFGDGFCCIKEKQYGKDTNL